MNRSYFFKRVRETLFGGKLSQTQVDGMTRILDYRDAKWPNMSDDELAYVLATVKWETAHTMQPIKERGSQAYLRSKKYYPWIGYGLVQLTWKANYEKFGVHTKPESALTWPVALDICFRGMIFGMFTGKKLSDYIKAGKVDYVGARRIINGTDKAQHIAGLAKAFREALAQAKAGPDPQATAPPVAEGTDQTTGTPLVRSTTAGAAGVAGAAGAIAPAVEAAKQAQEAAEAGKGLWDIAASVGPWVLLALVIAAAAGYIIWERRRRAREEGV